MKKQVCIWFIILTAAVCFLTALISNIRFAAKITHLLVEEETREPLRNQEVSSEMYETFCGYEENSDYSRYDYLLGYLITEMTQQQELDEYLKMLYQYKQEDIQKIRQKEEAIWMDLEYFPIPLPKKEDTLTVSFDNSWMSERTFGGERGHEGTDIMASLNERGHYPIVSMTDGVIEKVGWLKLGGYRIGIRSVHGGYFYYAHLYDYARDFKEGDTVKAGELLGFMGDSGYGEEEGTVGQFAVHLHVGIYLNDEDGEEFSVNPYWVLKWLEPKRLTYEYR